MFSLSQNSELIIIPQQQTRLTSNESPISKRKTTADGGKLKRKTGFQLPPVEKIQVFYDGIDVTPKTLYSTNYKQLLNKYNFDYDYSTLSERRSKSSKLSLQIQKFSDVGIKQAKSRRRTVLLSLNNIQVDEFVNVQEAGRKEEEYLEEIIPSGFCLPKMFPKSDYPNEVKLYLQETETIFLFEMPSVTETKDTEEGDLIEKDNETYEYLTTGKGRNRKRISTEAQTTACILKTRHTYAPRTSKKNNSAFASVWDMFDSYGKQSSTTLLKVSIKSDKSLKLIKKSESDVMLAKEDKDMKSIAKSVKFQDAVNIMERVLANNNFKLQQEDFKQLLRLDEEILEETYNYDLNLLWTFVYYRIENRPVTTLCINTKNTDIIAVGYGKYKYSEDCNGIICIWSIKNPTQPERLYTFEVSITSMAFSTENPNLLAVGFYNGDVYILDITFYEKNIIVKSSRRSSPTYQPVWCVRWYYDQEFNKNTEQITSISQDGRINTFLQTKTKDFLCSSKMRVTRSESLVKSMFEEDWCESNDIPIFSNTICTLYCQHPIKKDIYFIGTSDGHIFRCSTNYLNQHINFFLAHNGPVYGMQFSNFCKEIFVTCGADWNVKIWREHILTPLIVLLAGMNPVLGVTFCPTHSTIIMAISGSEIYLWDIQEKIDTPVLVTELSSEVERLSMLYFTANGKNIITADLHGGVHVHSLLGVVKPISDQEGLLQRTIHKILLIQPQLLKEFINVNKNVKMYC